MSYCTVDDLLKHIPLEELVELTTESGEELDLEMVNAAIAQADSEIEAYCGLRYLMPLSPVPPVIQGISVALALYHLYSRRSVAPAVRRAAYEEACRQLGEIAQGRAVLTVGGAELPPSDGRATSLRSEVRQFTLEGLSWW